MPYKVNHPSSVPVGNKREYQCGTCGSKMYRWPSTVHTETVYCSRSCHRRSVVGPRHFAWTGKSHSHGKTGYRQISVPGRGVLYEHRWVMEQHLGRCPDPDEHVHHIDGDRANNDLSNLKLMSAHEHKVLPNRRWARNHGACVACGETTRRHEARGLCVRCYAHDGCLPASK